MTAPLITKISRVGGGCFPAGTEVLTANGHRAIETVEPGTEVYACDLATGEWILARVLKRQSFQWEGDMITIQLGSITIQATGNHPFYVVRGDRLASRPLPQDVPPEEQRMTEYGRWVEARDLKKGDVLKEKSGQGLIITSLSSRHGNNTVYCLEVENYHNCAVTRKGILVRNGGKKEVTAESERLVTVYGRISLEHYEATVLGAADASALLDWLHDNDYQVSSKFKVIFEDYIERSLAFVAVKLNPGEKRRYANEFLPPLTIKYKYNQLIFPLLISSISTTERVKITLYVIAENTVISSNFPTATLIYRDYFPMSMEYVETCIQNTVGKEGKGLAILWRGNFCPHGFAARDFRDLDRVNQLCSSPLPECEMYVTRLEARINPADMPEDIIFVTFSTSEPFELRFR